YCVVFLVIRPNTVRRQDNRPISLVGINGGRANTGMRVNTGKNDRIGTESFEQPVEVCAIEGAVAFLDHNRVTFVDVQLWDNLTARCPSYRDANLPGSHFRKSVLQVRLKFLPHPDHGMAESPHGADEFPNRLDQTLS